jgi:hypothetical protein
MKRNGAFALNTMLSRTKFSRAWKVHDLFMTE